MSRAIVFREYAAKLGWKREHALQFGCLLCVLYFTRWTGVGAAFFWDVYIHAYIAAVTGWAAYYMLGRQPSSWFILFGLSAVIFKLIGFCFLSMGSIGHAKADELLSASDLGRYGVRDIRRNVDSCRRTGGACGCFQVNERPRAIDSAVRSP